MDLERARQIISVLAEGIDPITGEMLPEDHVCNQAGVIRAMYALLGTAQSVSTKGTPEEMPKNAGKPWTSENDHDMIGAICQQFDPI